MKSCKSIAIVLVSMLLCSGMFSPLPVSAQITAERQLPSEAYVAGVTINVSIKVTGAPGAITVVETPPLGWTVNRVRNNGRVNGGVITWELTDFTGSTTLGYTVTPPNTASGDAVFSGKVGEVDIVGMSTMTTVPPSFRFGAPVNLGSVINTQSDDWGPGVSADGLELYFLSNRTGSPNQSDIWVATRASVDDEWSAPVNLGPDVNSTVDEWDPNPSVDGLVLYFASKRKGGSGGSDLWMVTRPTKGGPWGSPKNLSPAVNSASDEGSPSITGDGLSLFFARSGAASAGGWDIYESKRAHTNADWSPAEKLGLTINSKDDEVDVSVTPDGLILFFDSTRPGGFGNTDFYVSTRETTDMPWSTPGNLGGVVNSSDYEFAPCISSDGRWLYFSDIASRRPGKLGGSDLWRVSVERVIQSAVGNWNLHR